MQLERPVAIKEFYPQEHAFREGLTGRLVIPTTKQDIYQRGLQRFLREGTLLAKLKHGGVVDVYSAFQERETAYLVMELISGRTLRDELEDQPDRRLSDDRIRDVMTQLVNALSVVHQREVYHLDIAPDNVIVTPEGRVVLIDFGASRQGLGGGTTQAFKESYAPPEVIDGKHPDGRSDIFELGMMLHELLSGELPPSSISRLLSYAHHGSELWDATQVPDPWRQLITTAIHLNPDHRPADVLSWWHSLGSAERRPTIPPTIAVPSIPPTLSYPAPSPIPAPVPVPVPYPTPISQSIPTPPPVFIPEPVAAVTSKPRPAGFWLRLMADLIDRTILIILSMVALIVTNSSSSTPGEYANALFVMYILLGFVYTTVLESSSQQATFGKQMMGIIVTDRNWRRLTVQRALARDACKFFSYLTLGIGFLMTGWTETRQSLHDSITNSFVIRKT
jgi:serine/threonine protein kinase